MIFFRILWLMKECLYRDVSWEAIWHPLLHRKTELKRDCLPRWVILWLVKKWLYPNTSWVAPCTLFSTKRRILKGQSYKINDFLQDSMVGEGVAVPGHELGGALHFVLRQKKIYKGTV
jgi:hypothetical protein